MSVDLNKTNCLNCKSPLQGNYCIQCGQKADVSRITFGETFKNFLSSTFSFEGPLLNTVQYLIVNPGKVFREFIEGKRKTYYQPVQFYVLLTAIYLITRALLDFDPLKGQFAAAEKSGSELLNISIEAARFMVDNINNIMFFLVFSIAFTLKLFFRKQYNLAEYTSVGLFICGLYTLFGTLMMVISSIIPTGKNAWHLLFLILLVGYSTGSLFKSPDFWSVFKYALVSVLSLILYMIFGFGFSFMIVYLR